MSNMFASFLKWPLYISSSIHSYIRTRMDERMRAAGLSGCKRTDAQHTKDKIKIEIINNKRWLGVGRANIELVSYGIIYRIWLLLLFLFLHFVRMCLLLQRWNKFIYLIPMCEWILEAAPNELKKYKGKRHPPLIASKWCVDSIMHMHTYAIISIAKFGSIVAIKLNDE